MMRFVEKLWNKLEIRLLLLSSLGLQILLLLLAGFRKRVISIRWAKQSNFTWAGPLPHIFHVLLWLAYLLADYVALVALAYLRDSEDNNTKHLLIFWAPFFLLHLGGQDTITALSIEDNELWGRHLLTMISQVVLAGYNYFMSDLHVSALWPPAVLMFVVGFLKYIERIVSLKYASMSTLRSSLITKPDPGPNYAKFMQEFTSSIAAGLEARIIIEPERQMDDVESQEKTKYDGDSNETRKTAQTTDERQSTGTNNQNAENKGPRYAEIVCKAYEFFPRFKRLFVDLILSYKEREDSQRYFRDLPTDKAYKLIEIELSWMYEILHSKASVIYTVNHYGWASRVFTLLATTTALILFAVLVDHSLYRWFDVALTYVLLVAALVVEVVAILFLFMSSYTYAAMNESNAWRGLGNFLFTFQKWLRPEKSSRWSNKMAQFSLVDYSLLDKPRWWKSAMKKRGLKETWKQYRYTTFEMVDEKLKDLVFQELKQKMTGIEDKAVYRRYTEHRGQWALQRKGYYKEFGWSVEAEFDESILLWHIATDLLFTDATETEKSSDSCKISQHISNYMMFLLIVRPFMMPAGIGQIRFGDSAAEVKNFLQQQGLNMEKEKAVKKILGVSTEYEPADIKGDRSKSLLFDGCKLAHQLQDELIKMKKKEKNALLDQQDKSVNKDEENRHRESMWELISRVWVEMLCYAASKCRGQFHAKQLSKGGELLTVVWFLMAHLGLGEQYRIEEGHARAKLIVSK